MNNNEKFKYTYSAPAADERREIDSIRRQYLPKQEKENNLKRLRKLDNYVKNSAVAISLALGVVGTLVFGLGLAMVLELNILIWGIVLMIVGAIPAALAYHAHEWILKYNKKKYGAEILRLSEELLKENEHEK